MAKCSICDKKIGFFDGNQGLCQDCFVLKIGEESKGQNPDEIVKNIVQKRSAKHELDSDIEAILLTTETHPEGLKITQRIEIVTAECAFGMNIFKDLFAGVRDIVGGRSEAVQKTMRDTRRTALYELKREAHAVGANAVIAVDLDYTELSFGGNMVLLVASGTAVRVSYEN